MLFWILVFFQIVSGLVAGASTIRQTPEGAKSIEALSKGGLFFLKWRAYSNYKQELIGLRNVFGITALIFTILIFSIGPTSTPSLFNALPGIFFVLWLTMQFGTNFKKSVKEQLSIAGLLTIGPWLILGMDYLTEFQFNQLRLMAYPFNPLGIQTLETYQVAMVMSFFGAVTGIAMAIFSVIIFSMVPLFFLFLIVSLSTFSNAALKIQPKTAKKISLLYCFLVGPLLMAFESKGFL